MEYKSTADIFDDGAKSGYWFMWLFFGDNGNVIFLSLGGF